MTLSAEKKDKARQALSHLLHEYKTASLATTFEGGGPHVSYTPVAIDEAKNIYLFVSELSQHTANLQRERRASLMLIEDEQASTQLFARNRLTLDGQAQQIDRDHGAWPHAAETYRARFGKFFDQLAQLRDFHMFRFEPEAARLVVGFGAAYQLGLPDWDSFTLLTK